MIYSFGDRRPEIAAGVFVAASADVIGSVRLGSGSSVWFNVVLRGDNDWIEVGEGSNIQDGSVIHTDAGFPTCLGARVTVGHKAFLHCATVGDDSMIANGAMVMDRVVIGRHCLIAAGAFIPPDKVIPDGSVVMGAPGRIVRQTTDRDLELIARAAAVYRERSAGYARELRPLQPA
jgi:carbonic anhydrase/acetyltransferase-like protein (isoleucine patch superfamily)